MLLLAHLDSLSGLSRAELPLHFAGFLVSSPVTWARLLLCSWLGPSGPKLLQSSCSPESNGYIAVAAGLFPFLSDRQRNCIGSSVETGSVRTVVAARRDSRGHSSGEALPKLFWQMSAYDGGRHPGKGPRFLRRLGKHCQGGV